MIKYLIVTITNIIIVLTLCYVNISFAFQSEYTIEDDVLLCYNLETIKEWNRLVNSNQTKDFVDMHYKAINSGECFIIPGGSVVYIKDYRKNDEAVQLSRKGDSKLLWTSAANWTELGEKLQSDNTP